MKKIAAAFLASLAIFTTHAATLVGTVDYVYDGDTVSVKTAEGKRARIRLDHVDAPEAGQRYGKSAQVALSNHLRGKAVRVEWSRRDEFGRPVGVIFLGRDNINQWLVREGHAWKYRYSRDMEYKTLMESAKRSKRGLWADPEPMDPWACRKLKAKAPVPAKATACK